VSVDGEGEEEDIEEEEEEEVRSMVSVSGVSVL
jgi:hypothetical protein